MKCLCLHVDHVAMTYWWFFNNVHVNKNLWEFWDSTIIVVWTQVLHQVDKGVSIQEEGTPLGNYVNKPNIEKECLK